VSDLPTDGGAGAPFDAYADDYEDALAQGLRASGETRDHFARGRLAFLARCLAETGRSARRVMDFGCGTGTSVPLIRELLSPAAIVGVDTSPRSIERAAREQAAREQAAREHAAREQAGADVSFAITDRYTPAADLDVAYTNGVFHHIPVADRPSAIGFLRRALRPGGVLALWENNPWSLGARYVMSRIPFDRDAVMLSARQARALARAAGFRVLRTDFLFVFPRALRALRPLEDRLRPVPVGAQYQVLCERA
jgi:SAM-dependent methyltransferase